MLHAVARAGYESVYPGVDALYYGNQRQLEYDFVVAPGADPSTIRLAFGGARRRDRPGRAGGSAAAMPTLHPCRLLRESDSCNGKTVCAPGSNAVGSEQAHLYARTCARGRNGTESPGDGGFRRRAISPETPKGVGVETMPDSGLRPPRRHGASHAR